MAEIEKLLNEAESKSNSLGKFSVRTLSEVAEFFGCALQTVKQWRIESPPMPGQEGDWPLEKITAWRHAKLAQSDIVTAKKRQELELGEIALQQKRLELDQIRGRLLEREDVELWAATALIELKELVMAFPKAVYTSVDPAFRNQARDEIDRECRKLLIQFQRRMNTDAIDQEPIPE